MIIVQISEASGDGMATLMFRLEDARKAVAVCANARNSGLDASWTRIDG